MYQDGQSSGLVVASCSLSSLVSYSLKVRCFFWRKSPAEVPSRYLPGMRSLVMILQPVFIQSSWQPPPINSTLFMLSNCYCPNGWMLGPRVGGGELRLSMGGLLLGASTVPNTGSVVAFVSGSSH